MVSENSRDVEIPVDEFVVLILVLMEDGLGESQLALTNEEYCVLILVLMEDGLGGNAIMQKH